MNSCYEVLLTKLSFHYLLHLRKIQSQTLCNC